MLNQRKLLETLDDLVEQGIIHSGQRQDVLNRGNEQARHLLLDKRAEMRRLMGRKRIVYELSEMELIASFRLPILEKDHEIVTEEFLYRRMAARMDLPFVLLDPLQLDYRLVTDSFKGPFAERHLIISLSETDHELQLAMAKPWDRELIMSIERIKEKKVVPVVAPKKDVLRIIAEFHGFRQ